MNLMARRPRVPLTNPHLISLSKQERLCPLCGRPTLLNGLERSANGAMGVCVNPDCTYFKAVAAPDWACVEDEDASNDAGDAPATSTNDRGGDGPWLTKGLFDEPVVSPYFLSLAKQERLCPLCVHKTHFAGTLNPDAVYEVCDDCGYFFTLVAPEWAWVKDAPQPVGKPKSSPRFTVIEDGLV